MKISNKNQTLPRFGNNGSDLEMSSILYSICTELFIEKINFKNLMYEDPVSRLREFVPFSQEIYESHDPYFEMPSFFKSTF